MSQLSQSNLEKIDAKKFKPSLLVIGYVWPEPESSAAGRHILSLIQAFQTAGFKVVFASPARSSDFMFDLSTIGVKTESIAINDDAFDEFCSQLNPTVVLFDRFMMEEQFGWRVERCCPNALRVLDTEDLQFLRDARHRAFKQQREIANSDFMSELTLREVAAILRSDLSLIISAFECELLQRQFNVPKQQLITIPFMVPFSEANFKPFEERQHFVAIGNFRHAPNWDSVLFLKQIWPKIRARIPQAELHIYGAYTPPKATALNDSKSGFLIKDRAQDAFQVIAEAKVLLAPLRFGAGIKGKLIDAMQMGTPSVTTPVGAESMHAELAWPGSIASNEDEFVQQAVELYENSQKWMRAQQAIAPIMKEVFDREALEKKLLTRVQNILDDMDEHRSQLFYNAMLRHHSLRSTEFMSRWIDVKNQLANVKSHSRPSDRNGDV